MRVVAYVVALLLVLAVLAAGGYTRLPFYTSANSILVKSSAVPTTRARLSVKMDELDNGVFVGVALSGGGSRAANLAAATTSSLSHAHKSAIFRRRKSGAISWTTFQKDCRRRAIAASIIPTPFSAATSSAKLAAQARISMVWGQTVNGERLVGGAKWI